MNYKKCYNFQDFRSLAKSKLPSPIFNYIDGAADDEVTYRRNTSSFDDVSLIPNVLRGVKDVDISTTVFGKKLRQIQSLYMQMLYPFAHTQRHQPEHQTLLE